MLFPQAGSAASSMCAVSNVSGFDVPYVSIASVADVPAHAPNPEYCSVQGTVRTHGEGAAPGAADFVLKLPIVWNSLNP
jgi:hypothetical protein